jgi:hypothetical protein
MSAAHRRLLRAANAARWRLRHEYSAPVRSEMSAADRVCATIMGEYLTDWMRRCPTRP